MNGSLRLAKKIWRNRLPADAKSVSIESTKAQKKKKITFFTILKISLSGERILCPPQMPSHSFREFSLFHSTESARPLFPKAIIRNAQLAIECILNVENQNRLIYVSMEAANANRECVFVYCYFFGNDAFIVCVCVTRTANAFDHSIDWCSICLLVLSCGVFRWNGPLMVKMEI